MAAPRRLDLAGLRRLDPLGTMLVLAGLVAARLPFVIDKANRIVPGDPRPLFEVVPWTAACGCALALLVAGVAALAVRAPGARLAVAVLALAALAFALGAAGDALTPAGNRVVRIAPGAAFWVLAALLGVLAADALARLAPGPAARVLALLLTVLSTGIALASGHFDHVSVMREYAVNADRFTHEAWRHVALAFGSLGAAMVVALPVGLVCHRMPRLRAAVIAALNVVQTVPAIALFGILMAPLGALAAALPAAAHLGVAGIGAAPALLALFLYALLPIVANTVAGLAGVSPAAVEAARGMGMTRGQILAGVEFVLALPVILSGVRIALVQNLGLVTVAALIGAGGFGTFVFQGIGQAAIDLVLLGAIPTVALAFGCAVLLDASIEAMQRGRA